MIINVRRGHRRTDLGVSTRIHVNCGAKQSANFTLIGLSRIFPVPNGRDSKPTFDTKTKAPAYFSGHIVVGLVHDFCETHALELNRLLQNLGDFRHKPDIVYTVDGIITCIAKPVPIVIF